MRLKQQVSGEGLCLLGGIPRKASENSDTVATKATLFSKKLRIGVRLLLTSDEVSVELMSISGSKLLLALSLQ